MKGVGALEQSRRREWRVERPSRARGLRLATVSVVAALLGMGAAAGLAAQDDLVLAALRGETGIDPEPATLLATVSGLSVERVPLAEALVQLAERSQVQIAFSPSLLPPALWVDCDCATLNLAGALDRLLAGTVLGYVELGSQVVVVPKSGSDLAPPDGMVRGRVRSEVAIPVEDATVRLVRPAGIAEGHIAGTDRLGFFAFHDLVPGEYVLSVSVIGYGLHEEEVAVAPGADLQLAITLTEEVVALEGLQVEGQRSRQRARFEESAGATVQEMSRTELKMIPGIAEADPLKSVEVLPGVTRVSDFAAAFNVRGGSADQNLILLDGVPIFNPFHSMGLFSVFNADMIRRAELQSGGFPAEYGGRVSSVLKIESDLGDEEHGVDAGMSLLAARASVKGGLPGGLKDRLGLASARWRASARRSYLDVLLGAIPKASFPYHLQDLQAAFEGWTRQGDRVQVISYLGRDVLDVGSLLVFDVFDGDEPELDAKPDLLWSWGNAAVGASWTRPMQGGGALDIRGSVSRADSNFDFSEFGEAQFGSRIGRSAIAADLERLPGRRTRWKSGVLSTWMTYESLTKGGGAELFLPGKGVAWGTAGYTQVEWKPTQEWLLEGGVRLDHWRPGDAASTTTVSPRVAVKRFVRGGRWALRVAGGRYTQFLHSVRDEQIPWGLDAWVLTGRQAPALVSDQLQAGVEGWLDERDTWFASAEGYYRSYEGVVARNWGDDPTDPTDDLLTGNGLSYGADFLVRKDGGRTSGWISISLLKANRRLRDRTTVYPPPQQVQHEPTPVDRPESGTVRRVDHPSRPQKR